MSHSIFKNKTTKEEDEENSGSGDNFEDFEIKSQVEGPSGQVGNKEKRFENKNRGGIGLGQEVWAPGPQRPEIQGQGQNSVRGLQKEMTVKVTPLEVGHTNLLL